VVRRNPGSDGAEESPSSDVQLTDENTADDETWSDETNWLSGSGDSSTSGGDAAMLRDPPNYYEAVQYLRQVSPFTQRLHLLLFRWTAWWCNDGVSDLRSRS